MTDRLAYYQQFSPLAIQRMNDNQCPNCGLPKSKWDRRTDWRCCSVECTKQFWAEHDKSISWSSIRVKVFKRDNCGCVKCGKKYAWNNNGEDYPEVDKLIADHIKPLAIDGAMWDMDNLQTLCIDCNKIKTAQDMKIIADYKRLEKVLNKNKQLQI